MKKEQNIQWDETLDPMAVMRISSAYWHSCVLHTANAIDVFNQLAVGPATAEELAERCQVDPRGLEMILIALVSLDFLEKHAGQFQNAPLATTFLVKDSPRYQGGIVSMFESWTKPWLSLQEAVMQGKPVVEKQHDHGEDTTHKYIMGMLYRGIPQAHLLAAEESLSGKTRLLDVGGGPGIFSIILCEKNSDLKAVVFDLPQTLQITKTIIADYQAADKVSTQQGSYLEDEFGEGYDVVLLSSMINQEGPDVIKTIIEKSFAALQSGGKLLIQEQLLNTEKTGPLLPVLIGLNQLIHTPAGRAYSAQEIADIAADVGFVNLQFRPLPDPSPFTLISANKP